MAEAAALNGSALIIGGGQASAEVAAQLRVGGFAGDITIVCEEPHLPYNRPALSKGFLAGDVGADSLLSRSAAAYANARVQVRRGVRAERIDRHACTVSLSSGESLAYDTLILATGGRARTLRVPGAGLRNIFHLRTMDDAEAIRAELQPGRRLVIVGGGYVGLEVAAVTVKAGLQVTVLEGAPRVLARVTAPAMSAFYERHHRAQGVAIHTGVAVSGFVESEARPGYVCGVACAVGDPIAADLVIVGIGLLANTDLAAAAGLIVDDGILVEADCSTADPRIYAIGDCASHAHHGFLRRKCRLESVPNALEQARTCAAAICGKPLPAATPPWFWSDQYGLKLQMVGISDGYDETVARGDVEGASFIMFYLADGQVIAADAVNRPADFMVAKRIVAERLHLDPACLADDSRRLKDIAAAHVAARAPVHAPL